ncbi:MAG: response regulator, partial [Gammaproteobacteria bacterium]|nr:response regulator [Gammaproteobacteria bacterium]
MLSELSNTLAPLIYLVASDKRLIEQVSRAIQDADYRVRTFTNTTDFHSICTDSSNECPDVIILDMNFVDVMNTLEGNNNGPIAPWLVLSASEKIEDNLVALRSGAQYCLKKPVNNAHLIDIMDEITDRRQSRVWHVLIISEKPDTFQKQIRLLQESDIIVQFSSEPLKTVELIENFNPDLILLDMAMEDPSAIELSNLLHGIDGNISVVFLGNETDALHESELYDAGVGELLLKTLSDVDFVSKVRACAKKERHYKIKHRRLESDIYKREREHQTLDYHAIVSIADR